jgi:hypothetical protein
VSCDAAALPEVHAIFERHGFAPVAEIGEVIAARADGARLTLR